MTDPAKPGGYIYRQHVATVQAACRSTRTYLRRLLDERPTPLLATTYLTHIALQIGEIEAAANDLATIVAPTRAGRTE